MKMCIITDSTFYMDTDILQKYQIEQVPLSVGFDNVTYYENNDDPNMLKDIFRKIKLDKTLPKSSQPSSTNFTNMFAKKQAEGYERIILFCISSKLSGTYQNAVLSAKMFMEENDIIIDVFDTYSAGFGSVTIVREVLSYIDKNQTISNEVVQKIIDHMTMKAKVFFVVDDLNFLAYGGRISSRVASLGNIVGLKPVLTLDDGELKEFTKVRSKKRVYKVMLEEFEKEISENDDQYIVSATHVSNYGEAEKLLKISSNRLGERFIGMPLIELGPVIAIHVGTGITGYLFVPKFNE